MLRKYQKELEVLRNCRLCPRNCGADRFTDKLGYCRTDTSFAVSSVCIHKGEEPVISGTKGICNVFFMHCNLQCIYCQNYQISRDAVSLSGAVHEPGQVIEKILAILQQGIHAIGFVSPSHCLPQMKIILKKINDLGYFPTVVYNSNGYDKVEELKIMEDIIDIYLADYKYSDCILARDYSDAEDYPEVTLAALKEMHRQKGSTLIISEDGLAEQGLIIRHLILPGHSENSSGVLETIAENISTNIHISLMAQYYPPPTVCGHPVLGRKLTEPEYMQVMEHFHRLGFHRGWIQDLEGSEVYRPDFKREHPFE